MNWPADQQLSERLAVIEAASSQFVGVNEIEHLLLDLTRFLESGQAIRSDAAKALSGLAAPSTPWAHGAIETLEFTMHVLKWEEVRSSLEATWTATSDLHARHLIEGILAAFDDNWAGRDIYRTFRGSATA